MSPLRESVTVKTPVGDLMGELFVGAGGLPELEVLGGGYHEKGFYTPPTFPAAWGPIVDVSDERIDGVLLEAWRAIEQIRQRIVEAQLEAEAEAMEAPHA